MRTILEAIAKDPKCQPKHLKNLVAAIRPSNPKNTEQAQENIYNLLAFLIAYPDLREGLRNYLFQLFWERTPLNLYTDSGILPNAGFFGEAYHRLSNKILPPLVSKKDLRCLLHEVFDRRSDWVWIKAVPDALWGEVFEKIGLLEGIGHGESSDKHFNYLLNALVILSHRITAIGLEPEVVHNFPEVDDLQSPFFALNREVSLFVEKLRRDRHLILGCEEDYRQILVMIRQSEMAVEQIRKNKDKYGISLRLTYLIVRLEQHLKRLRALLFIVEKEHRQQWAEYVIVLFKELIEAENNRNSLRRHFSDQLGMLTAKIVDHTSQKGKSYANGDQEHYSKLYRYALGGGGIVAFLVCFKTLISAMHLSPFGEALLFSLNYALGFCLIYVLHYTLATKQPAVTASAVASSLANDLKKTKKVDLSETVNLLQQIARNQAISLVGNVAMVIPVAYVLAWTYRILFGEHIASAEKAQKMAHSLHITESGSLFYAAIAGCFLMMSGLIAGYYDNKVIHQKIPQRIQAHPFLRRFLSGQRRKQMADYVCKNLGGLSGNVYLGFFLGSITSIGFIFGLPLDIRHVTFAGGGLSVALVASGHSLAWGDFFGAIFGIIGIGLVNVLVSFGLTMLVALRARNVQWKYIRLLGRALWSSFIKNPKSFIMPMDSDRVENKVVQQYFYAPPALLPYIGEGLGQTKGDLGELHAWSNEGKISLPPQTQRILIEYQPKSTSL